MIVPWPLQCPHVLAIAKKPCWKRTCPEPRHCGQVRGAVPGLAPCPRQVAQVLAPARPAAPTPTAPRSEEVAEEVADDVLEAGADVEPAETPLLEGGVSEAIIETAPLGVAENLVGLDQLLEALLGFGPVLGILVG